MRMPRYSNEPERPRSEPEIIPPQRDRGPDWPPPRYERMRGTQRVYVGRIGPLGFTLLMLIVALFGGILLLALIGAAIIWVPVVVVLLIVAAVSGLLRRL